jgi:hypothetical protein
MATFNFTFDPGTTLQQMVGFEIAGRVWSSYLTDNTTINIHAGMSSSLGTNVIGGALPGIQANVQYQTYRDRFAADRKSTDDNTAYNNLYWNPTEYQATGKSPFFKSWIQTIDSYRPGTTSDGKEIVTGQSLNLSRANAKALGITTTGASSALDGVILLGDLANSSVRWNYDYARNGSTPPSNTLDFLSTAIHEIGHVLGFVSGQDQPFNHATVATLNWSQQIAAQMTRIGNTTPLDFYRFTWWEATSSDDPELIGLPDFSYGDIGKFSLDGGRTRIMALSQGATLYSAQTNGWNWGDGYQSSHTEQGTNSIFSPTLSAQQQKSITQTDLRIFDVLGWDVNSNSSLSVNYAALATQSQQALATRLGQTVSWLNTNATTAANSLSKNRDQDIYTLLKDSSVYDLTRIAAPGATGVISRQVLAQVFQERGLFDTFEGFPEAVTVAGKIASDRPFTDPSFSPSQVSNGIGAIAPLAKIIQFYRETFSASVSSSPTPLQKITIEVSAQGTEFPNPGVHGGGDLSFRVRAYDSCAYNSEQRQLDLISNSKSNGGFGDHLALLDNLQYLDTISC